eukprot:517371-Hanusia_phi.AAC.1
MHSPSLPVVEAVGRDHGIPFAPDLDAAALVAQHAVALDGAPAYGIETEGGAEEWRAEKGGRGGGGGGGGRGVEKREDGARRRRVEGGGDGWEDPTSVADEEAMLEAIEDGVALNDGIRGAFDPHTLLPVRVNLIRLDISFPSCFRNQRRRRAAEEGRRMIGRSSAEWMEE